MVQKSSISYIMWRSTNIRNGYVTGVGHVCIAQLRLLYALSLQIHYIYVHASSSSQIIAKMYDPLLFLEVAIHMRTLDYGLGRWSIIDIEDLQCRIYMIHAGSKFSI